jgi:DNA-binding GntR family transcriptional regulator
MRERYLTPSQVVTEGLRKDILWGSLEPGRRLSQDEIALRHGVQVG